MQDVKGSARRQRWMGIICLWVGGILSCGGDKEGGDTFKPDCVGCRNDGQTCQFDGNCLVGRICNSKNNDFYVSSQPEGVCIKVSCESSDECQAGQICSLERLCETEGCQTDDECPGQICAGGDCVPMPSASDVADCRVVSRSQVVLQGTQVELVAVARDAGGNVLHGPSFTWTSDAPAVAEINGSVAVGGASGGTATVRAALTAQPSVTCSGAVSLMHPGARAAGTTRVIVVSDATGLPVSDSVKVVLVANAQNFEVVTNNGLATFQSEAVVEQVSVTGVGYQSVSVLTPGTLDIQLPLPKAANRTKAAGLKGALDLRDFNKKLAQLGIVAPNLPENFLDFDLRSLLGEMFRTQIDTTKNSFLPAALGDVPLPGNVVLALSGDKATASSDRCVGVTPGADDLGCYLVTAPEGQSAAWALSADVGLKDVDSKLIGELVAAFDDGGENLDAGKLLSSALPLLKFVRHGAQASLELTSANKVRSSTTVVDCADPNTADYDDHCRADYTQFVEQKLKPSFPLDVHSAVVMPNLPSTQEGECVSGVVVLGAVSLTGRGIVPMGVSAGLTKEDAPSGQCVVEGTKKPFGPYSADLTDGRVGLSMAPKHSGLEDGPSLLVGVAFDTRSVIDSRLIQISVAHQRVGRIERELSLERSFLAFPTGNIDAANQSVSVNGLSGASWLRVELQHNDDTWLVYTPVSTAQVNLNLPDLSEGQTLLSQGVTDAYLQSVTTESTYPELWTVGSAKAFARLKDTVEAFALQQCDAEAESPCRIQ